MSDSVRPHPWDFPGKNTGVGCCFLLQCMKIKSESEVTQSFLTLRDPMDCSLPGSSIHGIFQARVLKWGAIAFSRELVREYKFSAPIAPKLPIRTCGDGTLLPVFLQALQLTLMRGSLQ